MYIAGEQSNQYNIDNELKKAIRILCKMQKEDKKDEKHIRT